MATAAAALPSCRSFSSRGPTGTSAASPAGWRTTERGLCLLRPPDRPRRHVVRSATPSGPGFTARRAPGAETGAAEASAARAGDGGAGARRTRAGGVAGSWLPRLRQAGTLAPRPRPEPPGAARARTRGGRAGPVSSARVLGSRPGRNIPGSPRPAAPVPAPPPPRVFRPSKDRATQISLGCPLPSGPFSGRVSGAAKSLVFSPKWKVWGAGAAGAASNCSARSNSCQ